MSSFPILDLVVGMIFIFFLLSIICSSAVELWFSINGTRAKLLTQWLMRIFDSQALDSKGNPLMQDGVPVSVGQAIMDHCMVTALSKKGESTSYINSKDFVTALLDKISISPTTGNNAPIQVPPRDLQGYIKAIEDSQTISGELKRTILELANEASLAAKVLQTIPATANITNNVTASLKSE